MAEKASAEMLLRILDRMPGLAYSTRLDLATGKAEWLYVSPRMAEIHGVPESALHGDPSQLMAQIVDEDRAQLDQLTAASFQTLAPMQWIGRIRHSSGALRWVETQLVFERATDGAILSYGLATDVTERKRMEAALVASEAARARSDALYRQVIDALPVGIMVANQANEFMIMNPAQQRMSGGLMDHQDGDVSHAYGIFMADGVTPLPMEDTGMARGLRGEELDEEVVLRNPRLDGDVRLHVVWTPLRDEDSKVYAALGTSQDITLQRALERELRTRNEQLAASEEAKVALIDRLRYAIDELSNPILEVWDDVLVIPIIGVVDSRRTADMVKRLLAEVTRTQASFVIVDLTGVEIVDTKTADHLMKLVRKVEIVGARCVLTGIRPAVSETLVDIGVDLGRLTTLRNLKHGLRAAMRFARHERDGQRDLGAGDERIDESQPRRP